MTARIKLFILVQIFDHPKNPLNINSLSAPVNPKAI
ncbi:hypothetical protein EV194_10936 [Natronoflexus pectinivorans]|uniref:Uncharacterized protein n=1 Tax=Natronoflexus pectinivorans TaxID=682526 RepID=A0A4R2GHE8_9BACT|nr:hypothetical protein EV194_10936 [Natronoflexus pectinivorans]